MKARLGVKEFTERGDVAGGIVQGYNGPTKGLIDSDYILYTYFDRSNSQEAESDDVD